MCIIPAWLLTSGLELFLCGQSSRDLIEPVELSTAVNAPLRRHMTRRGAGHMAEDTGNENRERVEVA